MIGYADNTPEGALTEIKDFLVVPEESFVIDRQGDDIVGAFGFDADRELGRAWLWGPFTRTADNVDAMWTELSKLLPEWVTELEMFYDTSNALCDNFAQQHGFETYKPATIMTMARSAWNNDRDHLAEELTPQLEVQLVDLHDSVWPRAWPNGRTLLDLAKAGERRILVSSDGGRLLGYVSGEPRRDHGEVYIDFVTTAERARRKGIAERLTRALLSWSFAQEEINSVYLVVNQDRPAARALYDKLGFEVAYEMISKRRPIGSV